MERLAGGYVSGTDATGYQGQFLSILLWAPTGDTNNGGGNPGGYEDTYGNEGHWVVRLYATWAEKPRITT